MEFKVNPIAYALLGVNIIAVGVVSAVVVSQRILSDGAITARNKGLLTLAQHVQASTCWKNESSEPFKLGDEINTAGSQEGKIPTGCVYVPNHQQFLQVAYLDGQLKVVQVYSRREVRNQLSTIKEAQNVK